jgi:hypothetical protein
LLVHLLCEPTILELFPHAKMLIELMERGIVNLYGVHQRNVRP